MGETNGAARCCHGLSSILAKGAMGSKRRSSTSGLLLSRIKSYAAHHDISNAEVVADEMRSLYSEYVRLPRNVFVTNTQRAIQQYSMALIPPEEAPAERYVHTHPAAAPTKALQSLVDQQEENEPPANDLALGGNAMNNNMRNLYKQHTPAPQEDDEQSNKRKQASQQQDSKAKRTRRDPSAKTSREKGRPTARYSDLGGMESCLQDVRELIEYPLRHPEIYLHLGVEPPRGILLHGPPGCGKTLLANAVAGEVGVPFLKVSAPELVSGQSGESEKQIRELFEQAAQSAPSIIFIDEIDAVAPKRESAGKAMEQRIVAQMLTCMDDLSLEKTGGKPVLVIGATNRPDSMDAALRRAGRFDREIAIGIPNAAARQRILQVMSSKIRLSGDIDFEKIANTTPGFVGADLSAVAKEAAVIAVNRIFSELLGSNTQQAALTDSADAADPMQFDANAQPLEVAGVVTPAALKFDVNGQPVESAPSEPVDNQPTDGAAGEDKLLVRTSTSDQLASVSAAFTPEQLEPLAITMEDFEQAVTKVQPSSKREGFTTVPDVPWSAVGGMDEIRKELDMAISQPIKFPERFRRLGIAAPAGVLLWGPPGCGKTLVAKAVAKDSGANFISVKGPELLNKYVGESERAVRQLFSRAQASAPCIVFFDEMDALCPRRGSDSNQATERVVNQLLTELDGMQSRSQVFVIAATNRPELIDDAMKRPGRLDKLLKVGLPDAEGRVQILKALARNTPLSADVDLELAAKDPRCDGFSGADMAALIREAAIHALQTLQNSAGEDDEHDEASNQLTVTNVDLEAALNSVKPSVKRTKVA